MKGNKLIITFILSLIVCLVLIPTCAYADDAGTDLGDELSTAATQESGEPGGTPVTTPDTTPVTTPDTTPVTIPDTTPVTTPDSAPVSTPDSAPGTTPETTPETTLETTPGTTPETTSGTTPETTSGTTPETTSGTTPETTSGTTPETTSGTTPETTSGTTPETTPETPAETPVEASEPADNGITGADLPEAVTLAAAAPTAVPALQTDLISAQNGATVTMTADTTGPIVFNESKTITIDLGGNVLSSVDPSDAGKSAFTAYAGNVTLTNGTINGRVNAYDNSTLTLDSSIVLNGLLVVWGDGEGETAKTPTANVYATINNPNNYFAVATNGTDKSGAVINIYDGAKLSSDNVCIYLPSGNLSVQGGTITGSTGVYVKSGSLNVTGGQIIATGEKADFDPNNNGVSSTGDAITVEDATPAYQGISSVTISGGSMTSANANAVSTVYRTDDQERITQFVTGGIFSSEPDSSYVVADADVLEADGKYAIGSAQNVQSIMTIVQKTYAGEIKELTVHSVGSILETLVLPEGITVKNESGKPITVNEQVLAVGEETVTAAPVKPDAPADSDVSDKPVTAAAAGEGSVSVGYCVLEGKDSQWDRGSVKGLTFRLNSNKLVKVLIDGKEVEFEIDDNGVVTIAAEILEALEAGEHTVTFAFADGKVSTDFVING